MSEDLELRARVGAKLGWWVDVGYATVDPTIPVLARLHKPGRELALYAPLDRPWEAAPAWESSLDAVMDEKGPGGWLAERGWRIKSIIWPDGSHIEIDGCAAGGPETYWQVGQRGQEARLLCELMLRVEVEQ